MPPGYAFPGILVEAPYNRDPEIVGRRRNCAFNQLTIPVAAAGPSPEHRRQPNHPIVKDTDPVPLQHGPERAERIAVGRKRSSTATLAMLGIQPVRDRKLNGYAVCLVGTSSCVIIACFLHAVVFD